MSSSTTPVEDVLSALNGVKKSGEGWAAFCPAHDDKNGKSLSVSEGEDGRVLVHCFVGCSSLEVFRAIGMEYKDAFPRPERVGDERRYRVRDAQGRMVAIHHRRPDPKPGKPNEKAVWWTTPDGKDGLGGLKIDSLPLWGAEAVSSVPTGSPIVVCEGEKAAFALNYRGIPAVGTVTGANKSPSEDNLRVLRRHKAVLWPDADEEGQKHMQRIGKALARIGVEVRWYKWEEAPEKGDAADHPSIVRGGFLEELRDELYSAPRFIPPHDPATDGAASFAYALEDYYEMLEIRRKTGGVSGISLGIPAIDKGVHGFNKGYSYIIAARPNVGKSALAGQVALTAAEQGHRVLLQTPEMDSVQYLHRFSCRLSDVNYFDAEDGLITEKEVGHLKQAARIIADLPLFVDEYGGQMIRRIRENIERHEPDLVVIDYIQFLKADDPNSNRTQQVGQISRDLAQLKRDYKVPVVIAAQLNRAIEARGRESEPQLSDLRDTGELEQDADVVMFIHRPDMYNDDIEAEDEEIKILCRKNRMGKLWAADVRFVPGQQWFVDNRQVQVAGMVS